MKECLDCGRLTADPLLIFCLHCGGHNFEPVGDELPFEFDKEEEE